jgi:RimJ/RimL family protein N-acetyltransferase
MGVHPSAAQAPLDVAEAARNGQGVAMHPPSPAPTLLGDGITLRAHRAEDVAGVVEQCRDPLTQRWTSAPVPYTVGHAGDFVAAARQGWRNGSAFLFAVDVDGRFAGTVGLRRHRDAALGLTYGLAPWARGRQITVRALRMLLTWAFDTLDHEVVLWTAIAGNWPSRRTAWSVGIRVEGTVRGLAEQRGIRLDGWIGSVRRGDPLRPPHPWFDPPVLNADGVRLRRHDTGDVSAMAQACDDPDTQHWLPQLPRPYTTDDARAHLEEIAEEQSAGRAVFWAVADPVSDRLLGEIGMWGLAQGESRSAELGYWTHPAVRGRGVTSRAVRLATERALLSRDSGGLGLARLVIRAAAGNIPSQRIAEQAGFRLTGRDRGAQVLRDGRAVDLLRFDRLRGESAIGSTMAREAATLASGGPGSRTASGTGNTEWDGAAGGRK